MAQINCIPACKPVTAAVSVTVVEGGEAQNQIPSRVMLKGTARWLKDSAGAALEEGIRRVGEGIGATFGVRATVGFRQGVEVTANHPAERDLAAAAAAAVAPLRRDVPPAMTGEDFSWFL